VCACVMLDAQEPSQSKISVQLISSVTTATIPVENLGSVDILCYYSVVLPPKEIGPHPTHGKTKRVQEVALPKEGQGFHA